MHPLLASHPEAGLLKFYLQDRYEADIKLHTTAAQFNSIIDDRPVIWFLQELERASNQCEDYTLMEVFLDVSSSNIARAHEYFSGLEELGMEKVPFLGAALMAPRTLCAVYRLGRGIMVVTNNGFDWRHFLTLPIILSDDRHEIDRAAQAIASKDLKTFIPDLDTIEEKIRQERRLKEFQVLKETAVSFLSQGNLKDSIMQLQREIQDLEEDLSKMYQQLQERQMRVFKGISDGEIAEFLDSIGPERLHAFTHKKLRVSSFMHIGRDFDFFMNTHKSNHILFEKPTHHVILKDVMDSKLRIQMTGFYTLSSNTGRLLINNRPINSYSFFDKGQLVNPHINKYDCFNQHRLEMVKHFAAGKYENFILQAMECAGAINIYDGPSMGYLLSDLTLVMDEYPDFPVKYKLDGKWTNMTIKEYLNERSEAIEEIQADQEADFS